MPNRSVAFSGSQKKKQLQDKRKKKQQKEDEYDWSKLEKEQQEKVESIRKKLEEEEQHKLEAFTEQEAHVHIDSEEDDNKNQMNSSESDDDEPKNEATTVEVTSNVTDPTSKLRSIFEKEPKIEIEKRIYLSQQPFHRKTEEELLEEYSQQESKTIDMPKRPAWDRSMSADEIEKREEKMFQTYLQNVYEKYGRERLNYFEHNLEVWRQLWRVIEMSDILLLVADIRHPLFHFPKSLYQYVVMHSQKPMLLVLNKADLIPKKLQDAWKEFFETHYTNVTIVFFSSYTAKTEAENIKMKKQRKFVDRENVLKIWEALSTISVKKFSKEKLEEYWNDLIEKEKEKTRIELEKMQTKKKMASIKMKQLKKRGNERDSDEETEDTTHENEDSSETFEELKKKEETKASKHPLSEVITIGLIGHPNVGKSTVLNGLVGKKVVSTSYTPGHTKHFQTYFVSKHIRLCDSPGLVFPAIDMPRQLQVLSGIFPIAQVREPYSAVQYLCERMDLENVYRLTKLSEEADELDEKSNKLWTAWDICVSFALKRQFLTARAGRPDVYRAANFILRDVLYGNVLFAMVPPNTKTLDDVHYNPLHYMNRTFSEETNISTKSSSIVLEKVTKSNVDASKSQNCFELLEEE